MLRKGVVKEFGGFSFPLQKVFKALLIIWSSTQMVLHCRFNLPLRMQRLVFDFSGFCDYSTYRNKELHVLITMMIIQIKRYLQSLSLSFKIINMWWVYYVKVVFLIFSRRIQGNWNIVESYPDFPCSFACCLSCYALLYFWATKSESSGFLIPVVVPGWVIWKRLHLVELSFTLVKN